MNLPSGVDDSPVLEIRILVYPKRDGAFWGCRIDSSSSEPDSDSHDTRLGSETHMPACVKVSKIISEHIERTQSKKAEPKLYRRSNMQCGEERDHSILVYGTQGDGAFVETWVPKDVIHGDSEVFGDRHRGQLVVEWQWAKKQGWV